MTDEPSEPAHPTPEELRRFLCGELLPSAAKPIVAHLLPGCTACGEALAAIVAELFPAEPDGEAYELGVRWGLDIAAGYARALAELRRHLARREVGVAAAPGFELTPLHWRAACELLLEAAVAERDRDPAAAVELAGHAVECAGDLAPSLWSARSLADVRARALMELGNARRVANDLEEAEAAFHESFWQLGSGSGEPLLAARHLDLVASLFYDQRRFDEACRALDLACDLYRRHREPHLAGRALVKKAVAFIHAAEPEHALAALGQAAGLIDWTRDPYLLVNTLINTLLACVDSGRLDDAVELLWASRPLFVELGKPLDTVRLLGIEAKVAAGLGQISQAETMFREVKAGFEVVDLPYDAALVSLDIALLLVEQGRQAEVVALVDEMLCAFREREIHREAIASLLLLRRSAARNEATAALVETALAELRRNGRGEARGGRP